MVYKRSLSAKIILLVEIILLLSSVLFCGVSIYRARIGIRKAIQQRMLDIANCASGSVSGDVLKSLTKEDVGSEEYNRVYHTLSIFRDNVELEYVYSIRDEGNGSFIFTIDLDPETPASFGDSVKYTEALASAARGQAAVDEVPYSDAWGEFYSAYSPVRDSTGAVAGIIAVDFSADWFEDQLSAQTRSTILSYGAILVLTLFVAAFLALITVRPYVRMHEELLKEKVSAESANRAKSDFLANMSHEIRTPINAVLGMNEMILRESRQALGMRDGGRENALQNISIYAGDVESAGHSLLGIVNDILDFSRIEAGRMDLAEAPYQLGSLLNDVSNMVLFKAQEKGLDFAVDVDETLPDHLCGDGQRVRQIFTNLLNNAVKYTEQGSVRLTLRGERKGSADLVLKASVEDTGIGIRAEDMDKLFTKFQRLDLEHNSTVEGAGLGLAITRRLLELMGGGIEVQSEYGKGSVFRVTIPQKIVSDEAVGDFQKRFEAAAAEAEGYRESFHAPSAHVLIVDDTRMNLTVAVNLLKKTLLQIDTADSGADAVALAQKKVYDVILMDQRMPEMDGTEALNRIRNDADGLNRLTPVICLTADAVIGAKERYLAEGFSDYLTKPIDSAALERMLRKYLPAEKITVVYEEKKPEEPGAGKGTGTSPEETALEALRPAGIDPDVGLGYCMNDIGFYLSVLRDYAGNAGEAGERLQRFCDNRDWKSYEIQVHALKSTSKTIGAKELSDAASFLEEAASVGDAAGIRERHGAMMARYEALVRSIREAVPGAEPDLPDAEILEFEPMEFVPDGETV
ncbi:MAG: response regulator [Oscillospiraceae bacterium]|nr:response regulator [Oscillospiraceae bacterium]